MSEWTDNGHLPDQLEGRAQFLEDRSEVKSPELMRRAVSILREREQNAGGADGWSCIRCGAFVDVCHKCYADLHPAQAVSDVVRQRILLAIKHGNEYGWATARNELQGIAESNYFTHPAQAVSVPSDDAIREFLHESEGLLIASEDELLPLIREAVVALASASTAPAGDGGKES